MKSIIGVDIGGTFTDCYIVHGRRVVYSKVPTTPYDLSVCLLRSLEEGAGRLGMQVQRLLANTESIRYSTTLAMNQLIERKGSKLGLITTEGFEDVLVIGKGASWADGLTDRERRNVARAVKPEPLIPKHLTVGVKERVDVYGKVIRQLDEADVREKVYRLVDEGCRGFVVCLLFSFLNPTHERSVKRIIQEEFPEHYLGHMPVVLSSEVSPKLGEYERCMTTVLEAYLRQSMKDEIGGMLDKLELEGYKGTLMMVHNTGGMADVFKTSAVRTYNGGPVSGLIGGLHIAKTLGLQNVIVSDMGGTSFDVGMIVEGGIRYYDFKPTINRWLTNVSMLETRSIGAGGGSIAWMNEPLAKLEIGPQSAGSMPGPACYNLGGVDPTVTDADLVLGYISPTCFHGGRMGLNREKANKAIREKIARPMGVELEEAALLIKKIVDSNMGSIIHKETTLRGYDPRDFVLFSYGGAGPTHCSGYMAHAGVPMAVIFPFSPVFCALGSAMMDTIHLYEQSVRAVLIEPSTMKPMLDIGHFNAVVEELIRKAQRDLEGEGLDPKKAIFSLELEMLYGGQIEVFRCSAPRIFLKSVDDVRAVYRQFEDEFSKRISPIAVSPQGGVYLHTIALRATVSRSKITMPRFERKHAKTSEALKGRREVFWEETGGFSQTAIYDFGRLKYGNRINGPAVIEAEDTTVVIPPGFSYGVDRSGFGLLKKAS